MPLVAQSDEYLFTPELESLKSALNKASLRSGEIKDAVLIKLPDNNGNEIEFHAWESPVISDEMARAYPDFKTYFISGVQDKNVAGRIFVSRFGVEGMFINDDKKIKFEPIDREEPTLHKVFELKTSEELACGSYEQHFRPKISGMRALNLFNGSIRRTYEIAIVTTGEFYQDSDFGNNNNTTATAAVTNIINLANIRWNVEMSIHFSIFGSPFFHTNPSTDPFNPSGTNRTGEAGAAINTQFSSGGYDLGHVLHAETSGGSGIARIGAVCGAGKGQGWSGGSNQSLLAVDIMVHELGHMFDGQHTFNGSGDYCTANNLGSVFFSTQRQYNYSFEIGSGSTIMSYAGSCQANNNIQNYSDYYFHSKSLEAFINYVSTGQGNTCATLTSTGNTPPTVNSNPCNGAYIVPKLTPFSLQGSASDPDPGQTITYIWEQIDEDGIDTLTKGFIGTQAGNSALAPLFRSYPPSASGFKRTFPTLNTILNSANASTFEPLPNVARTLNFRLTARDNNPTNGGIGSSDLSVTVNGAAGPLTVTSPNTAVSWSPGNQTVIWDVNNTNTIFANVDILLSIDGGNSFPYILATSTPNDGSQTVTLPSVPSTTTARIKVRYAPNACFEIFDMSNFNFTIISSCIPPTTQIASINQISLAYNDPGLNLNLSNNLGIIITNFSGNISNLDSPGNLIFLNGTPSSCFGPSNASYYDTYIFSVDVTGSYTIAHGGPFGTVINLYSAPFSGTNCTNHISSNATRPSGTGSVLLSSSLTTNLTAGQLYVICISGFSQTSPTHPFNYNITFPTKPVGSSVYNGVILPSGYSYTYFAVNDFSGIINVVNNLSNFSSLTGGSYSIYGVAYYSGSGPNPGTVNPSSWVGQTLTSLLSSGQCLALSSNFKPLTVTCSSPNVTNSGNSGAGTLRDIFNCQSGSSTITYSSGVNSYLTAPLVINKNAIIQGSGNNTIDFNMTNGAGITINSGTSLTLRNIKVNLAGGASGPVIENHGTLILDNTEITGNTTVNTIIRNNGSGTVTVLNNNVIKKL